jgi:uncharacterized membrane protein YgdD (TMEM256/DUF423 family)
MILAVIFGAFGAHYLKAIFSPELLASFETGIRYQFYHAFALLFLGLYAKEHTHQLIPFIFYLFLGGVTLFSGSIYLLCILKSSNMIGLQGLGILTPLGGICFIIGWSLILFVALSLKKKMGD